MKLTLAQFLIHFNRDFSMIYLSCLIYPYAFHSCSLIYMCSSCQLDEPNGFSGLCPARGPWDLGQLVLMRDNSSRWQPCQLSMDHMHQQESSQDISWFDSTSPCLAQMAVLMRVNGSYIGQVIISLFFSNFSWFQECFMVISVWCLEKAPFIPQARHNLCCTCNNQKSERTYWFHRNSR